MERTIEILDIEEIASDFSSPYRAEGESHKHYFRRRLRDHRRDNGVTPDDVKGWKDTLEIYHRRGMIPPLSEEERADPDL